MAPASSPAPSAPSRSSSSPRSPERALLGEQPAARAPIDLANPRQLPHVVVVPPPPPLGHRPELLRDDVLDGIDAHPQGRIVPVGAGQRADRGRADTSAEHTSELH